MNPITALLAALGAVTAVFLGGWGREIRRSGQRLGSPNALQTGVGAFTNFFDTMGIALLVAAGLMFMTQMKLFPGGGDAIGVTGIKFVIAVAGNFMLGALMTLGIGLYAPCMILVSLLGMNPKTAFPIMMGSCAFLMPVGGLRFIREQSYSLRAAFGLALGGIPGVLLAAYIVKELPLDAVRWLVVVVVVYTAA